MRKFLFFCLVLTGYAMAAGHSAEQPPAAANGEHRAPEALPAPAIEPLLNCLDFIQRTPLLLRPGNSSGYFTAHLFHVGENEDIHLEKPVWDRSTIGFYKGKIGFLLRGQNRFYLAAVPAAASDFIRRVVTPERTYLVRGEWRDKCPEDQTCLEGGGKFLVTWITDEKAYRKNSKDAATYEEAEVKELAENDPAALLMLQKNLDSYLASPRIDAVLQRITHSNLPAVEPATADSPPSDYLRWKQIERDQHILRYLGAPNHVLGELAKCQSAMAPNNQNASRLIDRLNLAKTKWEANHAVALEAEKASRRGDTEKVRELAAAVAEGKAPTNAEADAVARKREEAKTVEHRKKVAEELRSKQSYQAPLALLSHLRERFSKQSVPAKNFSAAEMKAALGLLSSYYETHIPRIAADNQEKEALFARRKVVADALRDGKALDLSVQEWLYVAGELPFRAVDNREALLKKAQALLLEQYKEALQAGYEIRKTEGTSFELKDKQGNLLTVYIDGESSIRASVRDQSPKLATLWNLNEKQRYVYYYDDKDNQRSIVGLLPVGNAPLTEESVHEAFPELKIWKR